MDKATLDSFLGWNDICKQAETDLEFCKEERSKAEQKLRTMFEEDGVSSVRATDGRLVFLHRQLWARAKDGDKDAVIHALEESGLTEFITTTFNTNTISGYVREQSKLDVPLPESLAASLQVDEVFQLRVRKS